MTALSSSRWSASSTVVKKVVPLVSPAAMAMPDTVIPSTGMVTSRVMAADRLAVTCTVPPSSTVLGEAVSVTVGTSVRGTTRLRETGPPARQLSQSNRVPFHTMWRGRVSSVYPGRPPCPTAYRWRQSRWDSQVSPFTTSTQSSGMAGRTVRPRLWGFR